MKFWNTDTIRTKKCTKCGEVKNLETEFYKDKTHKDGYTSGCKECLKKQSNQWYKDNKEHRSEYFAQYYQNNKERKIEYIVQWKRNNREHINQYKKERYHSDPLYNLMCKLRSRTTNAFKAKGWKKDSSTQKMLGCDWETLKIHMESQFKDGMSWDNKGEWHDDHIIPLDCARDEEEMKKLCHYTNLRPMWGPENQSKSNKVLKEHYDLHYKLLGRYYK
jgi:hypothetical protein